jgi:hypothetical protein
MLGGRTPATPGGGADRHADRDVRATRAGRNPGIAIDFIEVEHAAVLRATRAGAEHRQCLAALDEADLAAFVSSLGIAATRIDQTYDSLVHAAQV